MIISYTAIYHWCLPYSSLQMSLLHQDFSFYIYLKCNLHLATALTPDSQLLLTGNLTGLWISVPYF